MSDASIAPEVLNPEEPTLRERLGGRWAISRQAFLLTLPLAPVVLIASERQTPTEIGGWLLAAVVGIACLAGFTYLMHRTVFRNRATNPVAVPVVIGSAALSMLVLIWTATFVGLLLGLPFEHSPGARVVQLTMLAVGWALILVLMLDARWRLASEREAIVERAVQQRLAAMQEADVVSAIQRALREDVSDELAAARDLVEQHLAALDVRSVSATQAADVLRATAEQAVRPLSHRLADEAVERLPRPRMRDALRNVIARQPFRPMAISIIYVVAAGPQVLERNGVREGLVRAGITIVLIVLTMSFANWAMRRWPEHHSPLFIAGIALIEAPSLIIPILEATTQANPIPWGDIATSVVVGIMLILITSAFGSWRLAKRDLLRTFASEVRQDEIETIANSRALADAAREAAGVLHGAVQTKLVACAMAIDQAATTGDVVAVNQALVQARAILEEPLPMQPAPDAVTLEEAISRKASLWRGLAEVRVEMGPAVAEIRGAVVSRVAAIVEEGIANAVQHGLATEIDIRVAPDGAILLIAVDDNGRGPAGGRPGLGSLPLDEFAPAWCLEAHEAGARLTVNMPIPGRTNSPEAASLWV